jgi:two-component system, NarL family, nitrate/nitrite sensor histidine kinase NarX
MLDHGGSSRIDWGRRDLLLAVEQALTRRRHSPQAPALLRIMLVKISEIIDTAWAAAWVYREEKDEWAIAASLGLTSQATRIRFRPGTALPCRCGERGEPLLINDLDSCEFHRSSDEHYRMRSALYAPMKLGKRAVGVVAIYSDQLEHYSQSDLQCLTTLAEHLGVTVTFAIMQDRATQIAVLKERDHHARDLHDGVHQVLFSLRIYALGARNALTDGDTVGALEMLNECARSIDEASDELSAAIASLRGHSEPLNDVYEVGDRMRRRLIAAGVWADVRFDQLTLEPSKSDVLAWICREATTNVLKHSDAQNVKLLLIRQGSDAILRIEDDGVGMDGVISRSPGTSLHIGLEVMGERASEVGGQLRVLSSHGLGTCVECRVPL